MKSVITQGSTIAKAIEEALKKSDSPQEFFVKVLEDAESGFLGFGAKKAKIALFFKNGDSSEKSSDSMLTKGSYLGLFNNPGIKKQIDQQLKELGLEIKPIKNEQIEKKPVHQHPKPLSMQVRPLNPKPQQNYKQQENQPRKENRPQQPQEETLQQYVSKQFNSSEFNDQARSTDQKRDENQSGQGRRRRYYRYRRNNRHRNRNDQQQEGSSDSFASSGIDNFKKDE